MSEKLRRILLIIAFIAATIGIALLLYFAFFRAPDQTPSDAPQDPSGLPTAGPGSPTTLDPRDPNFLPTETDTPADETETPDERATGGVTEARTLVPEDTQFSGISGQSLQYYLPQDGRFYRVTENGTISQLSEKQFPGVSNVVWSPNGTNAVLEFPDGANVVYNFNNQKQVTLPTHWEDFDFSNNGDALAFKSNALDPDNRWLGISNADGTSSKAIEPLGENGDAVIVDWSPSQQIVAMYPENSAKDEKQVYMVGLNGENFKAITAPGLGFKSQWTPTGEQLVFSVSNASNGYKPQIWIADALGDNIGQNRHALPINTWADKCTFSSSTLMLCAVPRDMPVGAGLVPAIQSELNDDIYSINLATRQKTLLAIPNKDISVKKLHMSSDTQSLYIESSEGQIYLIEL